jgi:ATP-dependent DNA helicase RecQ
MLVYFVAHARGAGILYVATRLGCDEIAELLRAALPRKVGVYHAGLRLEDRRAVQEAFMVGDIPIIVATNAFGMGINKADLRFVVHYNMPGSLEAYYQEAGRAGRDGLPARCLLLYSPEDRCIQEFFIENNYPSRATVARVYEFLCGLDEDPIEVTQQDLKDRLSLEIGGEGIGACEQLLERCGAIERLATQENRASVRVQAPSPTLDQLLPKEAKTQRRVLRAVEQFVGAEHTERVYFSLEKLAESAGVPRDAVLRALRELRKLPGFDYVPPFRGRAVHVVDRHRPFDTLEIDFATLEKRKANEYDKLERMIGYAEARDCRQLRILDYFGDPNARDCGACDNCGPAPPVAEPTASVSAPADQEEAVLQCIRMALSGVARTRGRVGKGLVAKMLCGSRSQPVLQLRLDQLSTFGLLTHLRQSEATSLLNALIQADLVEQTENQRNRPIVKLTSRGEKVMKGHLRLDPQVPLRAPLRTKLQKTPLARTVARAARTSEPVPSLGRTELLTPSPPPADHPAPMGAPSPTNHPDYYWTWRVVSAGCTPDECGQIRRLDQAEVWDHLRQAAGAGLEMRAADVFTPTEISRLLLLAGAGDHAARVRAEPHANPVTADQLAVFQSCQDRAAKSSAGSTASSDQRA